MAEISLSLLPNFSLFAYIIGGLSGLLISFFIFSCIVYIIFGFYVRHRAQIRLFLSFLSHGLDQGRPLEESLRLLSVRDDRKFEEQIAMAYALIEKGESPLTALSQPPYFLPVRVKKLLQVSEDLQNPNIVIERCLKQMAENDKFVAEKMRLRAYEFLLLVVSCFCCIAITINKILVIPQFHKILADYNMAANQFDYSGWFALISIFLFFFIIIYTFWPFLFYWVGLKPLRDRLMILFPWRRTALQRDFCIVLAILLDDGLSESEAVQRAADALDNNWMEKRAQRVQQKLAEGSKLQNALRYIDPDREFSWRIANASHTQLTFMETLQNWEESLRAREFRQTQMVAQVTIISLTLINSLMVSTLVLGLFSYLIQIIGIHLW